MSESADEISKLHTDVAEIFAKLIFANGLGKMKRDELFQLGSKLKTRKYAMPPVPNSKNVKLTSQDGKQYICSAKADIEIAILEMLTKEKIYENTIKRINSGKDVHVDKHSDFTKQMFASLGGVDSELLHNTERMELFKDEHNKISIRFDLNNLASKEYGSVYLRHYTESDRPYEYMVGLRKHGDNTQIEQYLSNDAQLERFLTEKLVLNEKACLINKKEGYLFNENEIDKAQLKDAGIKWSELSEVQKNDLLKGKETSSVAITRLDKNGKKHYSKGHLKLSRLDANSANVLFRPENSKGLKKSFVMKM